MANEVNYSEKYDVFLSYRRDGGETMAILLRDRLTVKGYKVFLDIESLNSGSFNKKLLSVIEGCTDVVVVCSKNSLARCANKGDWVRAEIAHALKNGKNVVPVMLRGFEWPDVLPDEIEALRMQNGVNANSTEYFDAAIDRLASKFLQSTPHGSATKKSKTPKQPKNKKILATVLSLVLIAGLIFGGMALWGKKGGTDDQSDSHSSKNHVSQEIPKQMTMTTAKEGEMKLYLAGSGLCTINWGDGSDIETHTISFYYVIGGWRSNQIFSHIYFGTASRTITVTGERVTHMVCQSFQITSMDVSKNTELNSLSCQGNSITVLDVSKNTALTDLACGDNPLKSLDVSKNTALQGLDCVSNQLTSLDVSKNTALTGLFCQDNQLTVNALNALFGTLHNNGGTKYIYIKNNPGTATCDRSIAEKKGWKVVSDF